MSTARLLSNPATLFTATPLPAALTTATPAAILSSGIDAKSCLIAELLDYGKRPFNWDGEGAISPLKGDVEAALSFLESYPVGLELPKSYLYSAGDVAFYWEKGEGYADLEFFRGNISLYTNSIANRYKEDELIGELVVEDLTPSWIETTLGFFKEETCKFG